MLIWCTVLVCTSEEYSACRGFAGYHTGAGRGVAFEGDAADGSLGFLLDPLFSLGRAIPMGEHETTLLNLLLELLVGIYLYGVLLAVVECLLVDALLNFVKEAYYIFFDTVARDGLFF